MWPNGCGGPKGGDEAGGSKSSVCCRFVALMKVFGNFHDNGNCFCDNRGCFVGGNCCKSHCSSNIGHRSNNIGNSTVISSPCRNSSSSNSSSGSCSSCGVSSSKSISRCNSELSVITVCYLPGIFSDGNEAEVSDGDNEKPSRKSGRGRSINHQLK